MKLNTEGAKGKRGVAAGVSASPSGAANGGGGRQPPDPCGAPQPSMLGWAPWRMRHGAEAAHERPPPKINRLRGGEGAGVAALGLAEQHDRKQGYQAQQACQEDQAIDAH